MTVDDGIYITTWCFLAKFASDPGYRSVTCVIAAYASHLFLTGSAPQEYDKTVLCRDELGAPFVFIASIVGLANQKNDRSTTS